MEYMEKAEPGQEEHPCRREAQPPADGRCRQWLGYQSWRAGSGIRSPTCRAPPGWGGWSGPPRRPAPASRESAAAPSLSTPPSPPASPATESGRRRRPPGRRWGGSGVAAGTWSGWCVGRRRRRLRRCRRRRRRRSRGGGDRGWWGTGVGGRWGGGREGWRRRPWRRWSGGIGGAACGCGCLIMTGERRRRWRRRQIRDRQCYLGNCGTCGSFVTYFSFCFEREKNNGKELWHVRGWMGGFGFGHVLRHRRTELLSLILGLWAPLCCAWRLSFLFFSFLYSKTLNTKFIYCNDRSFNLGF